MDNDSSGPSPERGSPILPEHVMTEKFIEAPGMQTVLETRQVGQLRKGSTTPDVHDVEHWKALNTAPVLITHFLKGQEGQHLYILGDGLTTVQHNAHIITASAADVLLNDGTLYHFLGLGNPVVWHQQNDTGSGSGSGGVIDVFGRTGNVVALQADYDAFFLTPAEAITLGDARWTTPAVVRVILAPYSRIGHVHDYASLMNIPALSPVTGVDSDALRAALAAFSRIGHVHDYNSLMNIPVGGSGITLEDVRAALIGYVRAGHTHHYNSLMGLPDLVALLAPFSRIGHVHDYNSLMNIPTTAAGVSPSDMIGYSRIGHNQYFEIEAVAQEFILANQIFGG